MQGDLAELNITSNWFSLLSGRLAQRQLLEHLHGDMRVNIQLYIKEPAESSVYTQIRPAWAV